MAKCKIVKKDKSLKVCDGMQEALNRSLSRNNGFQLRQFANMNTNKFTRQGIDLKNGSKDRGISLNYCPFCGVDIATHYME